MRASGFLSTLLLATLVAAAPAPAAKRQCSAPVPSTTVAPPATTPIPPPETSTPVPTETTSDPSTPPTETEAPPTTTDTEAPPTSTPPPAGGGGGGTGPTLRKHALVGYLHSSFMNGAGYIRMKDVGDEWDIINLSFGEPDTPTSGNIEFSLCPVEECPDVESEAEFIAAVDEKVAQGKLVQLSIGGEKGQVRLETEAARDKFVETISAICDKYHLTGLDIDFEGQSLSLDAGDSDFTAPTTPVIVNLISAMKTLKAKYPHFSLTMAPETFFVQLGVTFYGSGEFGGQDSRAGAYLPVIHALRDDLTMLHVQNYNSGPITGLDGKAWTMGSSDFHVAMTDVVLQGFNVAGKEGASFPPLRPDQVGFGVPSSQGAGNGFVEPAVVQAAAECLMKGTNCGEYKPAKAYADLRGVMTWSINWDHFFNGTFASSMRPFLDAL